MSRANDNLFHSNYRMIHRVLYSFLIHDNSAWNISLVFNTTRHTLSNIVVMLIFSVGFSVPDINLNALGDGKRVMDKATPGAINLFCNNRLTCNLPFISTSALLANLFCLVIKLGLVTALSLKQPTVSL